MPISEQEYVELMRRYLRQARRARSTGTMVELYDTQVPQVNTFDCSGGRWVTICEHGSVMNHRMLNEARSAAAEPDQWCDECRAAQQALNPSPQQVMNTGQVMRLDQVQAGDVLWFSRFGPQTVIKVAITTHAVTIHSQSEHLVGAHEATAMILRPQVQSTLPSTSTHSTGEIN